MKTPYEDLKFHALKWVCIWVKKLQKFYFLQEKNCERGKQPKTNKAKAVPVYAINAYGRVKVQPHPFLPLALYGVSVQVNLTPEHTAPVIISVVRCDDRMNFLDSLSFSFLLRI
jgi:hypothetical protein